MKQHFFKLTLLFFMTLTLSNCYESDNNETLQNDIENIRQNFTIENFNKSKTNGILNINWNDFNIIQNHEDSVVTYEFNTIIKGNNYIENHSEKLYFNHKLLASRNNNNNNNNTWNIVLVKFISKCESNLEHVTSFALDNFSGTIYDYNTKAEISSIKVYDGGTLIDKVIAESLINSTSKIPQKDKNDAPNQGSGGGGSAFQWVPIRNFTDWYKVFSDGSKEYTHSVFAGITYEYIYVGLNNSNDNTYHYHSFPNYTGLSSSTSNHDNEVILNIDNLVIFEPDSPINNIGEFLECFDPTQDATLTIYATEPDPGTGEPYELYLNDYVVGHTFVSITQGSNTSVFGFYPEADDYTQANSSLGNDSNESFTASISTNITGIQLQQILNHTINVNSIYDVNDYNCTNFAIEIGDLGGLNLPNCEDTWPGGGGANPGTLGLHIRNLGLSNSYSTNTSNGSTAPTTHKGC